MMLFNNLKRYHRFYMVSMIMYLTLPVSHVFAEDNVEYQVKAGFIYNFIGYTKWPETSNDSLNLCIHGKDYFGESIDTLQHKQSNKGQIQVLRLHSESDLESCHAVFISKNAIGDLSEILNKLEKKPVLTLADSPNATSKGVMINMSIRNERIVFEINLIAARRSGLQISSKVLQLAIQVHK